MKPQRKSSCSAASIVRTIVYCLYWVIDDTLSRIADRCCCRGAFRSAINKLSVCHYNSGGDDRRRMYRQAPTAFCRGKIGVLSSVLVAAPANWGALISAQSQKPFLSGFKRCTFFLRKESTSFAPAAGCLQPRPPPRRSAESLRKESISLDLTAGHAVPTLSTLR